MPRFQSVEQDDEIMLMRSPVHPSLARWALREQPTGRRRVVAAYLTATAGAATSIVIIGITLLSTRHCQVTGGADLGCLAGFFHGLGLSIIGGLIVTSGLAVFLKLGLRYLAALLALVAPVLLIAQLLALFGVEARPYALIALVGVPAVAGWLAGRMVDTARPDQPAPVVGKAAATRASRSERAHRIGRIFVR